jgi:4-amino-4-deoxy-L-arabinose transferase-like glycosyltransferase
MKQRTAARLAWGILAFIGVSAVVSITLALESERYDIFFVAVLAIFPVVGVVLASRRPSNPLGRIMLGIGVVWALPSGTYGVYGLIEGRHLPQSDAALAFEVDDDGAGFDPTSTGYGTGLQGIADRLAALDGRIEIQSRPGGGTVVTGTIPLGSRPPQNGVPRPSIERDAGR